MDADALKELFQPFGAVAVRRMFGGKGVYADELMFAMAMGGEVYLKCDAATESLFAEAGSTPFIYQGHSGPVKVNFRRLVASAYDDDDELKRWCALAIGAARRAAQRKRANPGPPKRQRAGGADEERAKEKISGAP